MKDAKSEAQKEIEDYRQQKETEFKSFESEVSVSWNNKSQDGWPELLARTCIGGNIYGPDMELG